MLQALLTILENKNRLLVTLEALDVLPLKYGLCCFVQWFMLLLCCLLPQFLFLERGKHPSPISNSIVFFFFFLVHELGCLCRHTLTIAFKITKFIKYLVCVTKPISSIIVYISDLYLLMVHDLLRVIRRSNHCIEYFDQFWD